MSFHLKGRANKTRAAYRMSDGRVPTKDTALEVELEKMLNELGYQPKKDVKVTIPEEWTRYDHDVILEPDFVTRNKVILADGWHYHNRTENQRKTDEKKDGWYNLAGYHVIHVGEYWFKNEERRAILKSQLSQALVERLPVIDLAN